MEQNTKNQLRLQEILFEMLEEVHAAHGGTAAFNYTMTKAEHEAKVAKQIINSADIILRGDKLCGKHDRINDAIGDKNNEPV